MFDDNLKVTTVAYLLLIFIYQAGNLMNLHLESYIELSHTDIILKPNSSYFYCLKSRIVVSLLQKLEIIVFPAQYRFPLKSFFLYYF